MLLCICIYLLPFTYQNVLFGRPGHAHENILSRVIVTNNADSGVDERVYLLLVHTTSSLGVTPLEAHEQKSFPTDLLR
jgi:hypothetical protein